MFALKLFVTCAVVCCVLSETELEKLANRFCVDTCNNVGVVLCGNKLYGEWIEIYDKCLSAKEKGFSSVKEFNKFICEEMSQEEFFRIVNCFMKDLIALYTEEDIMNASTECMIKNGC